VAVWKTIVKAAKARLVPANPNADTLASVIAIAAALFALGVGSRTAPLPQAARIRRVT
jgi:hypothetical protein